MLINWCKSIARCKVWISLTPHFVFDHKLILSKLRLHNKAKIIYQKNPNGSLFSATELWISVQFYPFLFAHFIMIIHNYAWWWCCSQGKGQACYIFIPSAPYFVHFLAKVIKNSSTEQLPAAEQIFCNEGKGSFSQLPQGCSLSNCYKKNWLYVHVILSSSQKKSHYGPDRTITGWVWNKSKQNVTSKLEKKMNL